MQEKEENIEEYSINELNLLISLVKSAFPNLTEESIAKGIGYNEGYISQCRSRDKVSKKFYENVQRSYLGAIKPYRPPQIQEEDLQEEPSLTFIQGTIERMLSDRERALSVIEQLTPLLIKKGTVLMAPPGTKETETKNPRRQKKPTA